VEVNFDDLGLFMLFFYYIVTPLFERVAWLNMLSYYMAIQTSRRVGWLHLKFCSPNASGPKRRPKERLDLILMVFPSFLMFKVTPPTGRATLVDLILNCL
jgi:hypothetical protein